MTYPSSVSHEAIALRLVFYIHMYTVFFLMTVITLRLTALALYRKPSTNTIVNAPPPTT